MKRMLAASALVACTYSVGELAERAPDASTSPDGGRSVSVPPASPTIIADAQNDPQVIAVDARSVYWGTADGVWYCPTKDCATVKQLASEERPVVSLAPTSAYLFWTLGAEIMRWSKTSGEIVRIDDSVASSVTSIAADESSFYWTVTTDPGGIARCGVNGCRGQSSDYVAAYGWNRPIGLALNRTGFAFAAGADRWNIMYCAPRCGEPGSGEGNVLAEDQPGVTAVAVDERFAFWTTDAALMRASTSQPFGTAPLVNGTRPSALALDATHVYFLAEGSIFKVPKQGGTAVAVARDLPTARAIAVDDQRLYVAHAGRRASVVWIAK